MQFYLNLHFAGKSFILGPRVAKRIFQVSIHFIVASRHVRASWEKGLSDTADVCTLVALVLCRSKYSRRLLYFVKKNSSVTESELWHNRSYSTAVYYTRNKRMDSNLGDNLQDWSLDGDIIQPLNQLNLGKLLWDHYFNYDGTITILQTLKQ